MANLRLNLSEIDKIKSIHKINKSLRKKNLDNFNNFGLPSKKDEDWKFSDFKKILDQNFSKITFREKKINKKKVKQISDFDHNKIVLINGKLIESNFKHEDKNKISLTNFDEKQVSYEYTKNSLISLNHALCSKGYFLSIKDNYKFKKTLVVYNYFSNDLSNNFLNNNNKIIIGKNSEIHLIEYTINESKKKFVNNCFEKIILKDNAILRHINLQAQKSNGYFYKYSNNELCKNSNYAGFIFSSGLKFNKIDMQFDLSGEYSNCKLLSGLFLTSNDHQELKTKFNHLVPNCKSHQNIRNVLESKSKGIYQGKIFVKNIAQKTDAYQLSKGLILSDESEFNSKPELEIYADDVKCSHGSTSGNVDENSIHYLMTRGLNKIQAVKLLVNGFLSDITNQIKSDTIRNFIEKKLIEQINEYKNN